MAFYLKQKQMTRGQELVMLRKLHNLEAVANAGEQKSVAGPTLASLTEAVATQAAAVTKLKADKAAKEEITAAVALLLEAKAKLKALQDEKEAAKKEKAKEATELRAGLEDILLRKFFYVPSFEIYGGVGGLYDFGPTGCALKSNILDYWRQHFVLAEKMLEVSCSALTPDIVLRTSGHVEKFTDFMVKDLKTGDCHRADKLLEDHIDDIVDSASSEKEKKEMLADKSAADALSQEALGAALKRWGVKAPTTNNDVGDPFPFNLMFVTQIGPTGKLVGYMRPETAQGIFVNFRRLLEYNAGKMPFAAAQIGLAYRNEISPRSGLLRVREFPLAEIEHFVNPENKNHPKFKKVANLELTLLPKAAQTGEDICVQMTVGEAVKSGTINNETLGYYMARTFLFLTHCGVHADKLRFRQHKDTEMAHYAKDCWDAEILMTYGWVECVGHADRAAYDLQVHSAKSKVDLIAQESYDQPRLVKVAVMKLNAAKIGKTYGKGAKVLSQHLKEMPKHESLELKAKLEKGPVTISLCTKETFEVTSEMVTITEETKKINVIKYTPSVVEPSFGVGRIMYGILEHSYTTRTKNGETQGFLSLSPSIAPVKATILPLGSGQEFDELVSSVEQGFVNLGLSTKTDTSGASIGRKYARSDEIGVPFAITLDFDTPKDNTVTVRDRDSTQQIRLPIKDALEVISSLCTLSTTWAKVYSQWPHQAVPEEKEEVPAVKKAPAKKAKAATEKANKKEKPAKKEKAAKTAKKQDSKATADAEKAQKKLLAQIAKEGGKKAQDIAGLRDMGGVSFFHVALPVCKADLNLLQIAMDAMNVPCPEDAEERRGGAGDIGKTLLSFDDDKLVFIIHVPKALAGSCSIETWKTAMCGKYKVKTLASSDEYFKGQIDRSEEDNCYPIKVQDDMINRGFQMLAEKKLVLADDDDEDEMVFGDDDYDML
eukprot:CAMPEP_0175140966 /NCGR_PEP_ID=MMETSP0087-20121206/11817_1 /TAXON_ID=136419 /ORGANISM="Unknown Unknown, Strain D1" /LENGTH=941 /DNA_ID=CAMNT_0016424277 /DNA_START=28 /DNA_END=2853 /DNA_ORIENTATION=+